MTYRILHSQGLPRYRQLIVQCWSVIDLQCVQKWQSVFLPEFHIFVFTYNRVNSLKRLLASLANAVYSPLYTISLRVYIDWSPETASQMEDALKAFEWSHGPYEAVFAQAHKVREP